VLLGYTGVLQKAGPFSEDLLYILISTYMCRYWTREKNVEKDVPNMAAYGDNLHTRTTV
jgi:hypothetical protein